MPSPARTVLAALASAGLSLAALASPPAAVAGPDAPDDRRPRPASFVDAPSYAQALAAWRSAEDVNAWIGAKFEYDGERAVRLSETQRRANCAHPGGSERDSTASARAPCGMPVHPPATFFAAPRGVCVDLSRFAVETLARIAPELRPRYVMIEFDPVTIRGNALRRHWVAAFEREGKLYFFGDSKRPGHMAGPYESTKAFVDDYAIYRGRAVIAFAERSTYERTMRTQATRRTE